MNLSSDIRWLYGAAIAFLTISLAAIYFEIYALLALPALLLVLNVLIVKPRYILYLLAFATPLSVHLIDERYSTVNLSLPTEPLIILIFLGVLFRLFQLKKITVPEVTATLSILILADFGWLVTTAISSTMPLISAKYVIMRSWYIVVFYFLLSRVFQKEKIAKQFIWCFIVSILILSAYTLFQHSQGAFSRAWAYTAMRPFLPDHGMYAACISFIIPILFVFAIHGRWLGYSATLRIFCVVFFLFMIVAVALSFTRASWVSLVVSLVVYLLMILKVRFKYLLVLAVAELGTLVVYQDSLLTDLSRNKKESDDNIENHLQSIGNVSSDPSNLERLNRWGSAIRMFEEKPILGWGPGTYTFQYAQFQLPHEMTIISTNVGDLGGMHSEYLRPLSESGVLGLVFFVAIVVWVFSLGFKHYRVFKGSARYLSMAVFLGLVTYFVHGVLNNYIEFDKIAVPLYSFMAVMTALEINYKNAQKNSSK